MYPGDRDLGSCMGPDGHLNMLIKNGDMPPDGSYYPFEGEMVNDYYTGNDFKPVNDDMMNMKNNQHLRKYFLQISLKAVLTLKMLITFISLKNYFVSLRKKMSYFLANNSFHNFNIKNFLG